MHVRAHVHVHVHVNVHVNVHGMCMCMCMRNVHTERVLELISHHPYTREASDDDARGDD